MMPAEWDLAVCLILSEFYSRRQWSPSALV